MKDEDMPGEKKAWIEEKEGKREGVRLFQSCFDLGACAGPGLLCS
jgi:hypothetical protein